MAKPGTASPDEQGLTKKQLKRLERKRKKSLAEASLLPGSSSGNVAAALDTKDAYDGDHGNEDGGVNAGEERAKPANLDAGEWAPGGGISREEDADKASASFDIRNSLVGKVAEALLAKQLEEERAAVPARKRARLGNKASAEVVPNVGEPVSSGKEKGKEGKVRKKRKLIKKEKKEKNKEKKRKKKEQERLGLSSDAELNHDELPESATRKRQRGVKDLQQKVKTPENNSEGRQTRSSTKRKGEEKERKQKTKLPKKEQTSPWPDIKYEASSAQVVLRQGQSVMIDGAANVTLIAGGASVMGYRLRRNEEVLVTSCKQLAPVSIIVHNGAGGRNDLGVKEHENRGLTGGKDGATSRGEEAVVIFRSCWLGTSEGAGSSGGQRTFRLEAKASAGASRSLPQAPMSESRNKGNEIQLQPTIIPLAWKTVTDSVLNGASTATRAATEKVQSDGLGGTGLNVSDGAAEAGVSGRPPIVVICGGKNVGKSTYGRYLVNRLLNRYSAVAYLETDVGQPEFTAPGLLSLHLLTSPVFGPPSTHMRDPKTSFFYGDVSAKTDPELYLRCVVALYDEFRRNHYDGAAEENQLPLVINTHGWVKGLGLDVLIDILRYTVPTHVVDVQSAKANKNLPPGNFWETTMEPLSRVHYIPTAVSDQVDASTPFAHKFAPEERALRLLAHFQTATASGAPPGLAFNENDAYSSLATCLVHHRPFQVRLDAVRIYHLHGYVPPEEALWALNGAVVGLATAGAEPETGPMPRCLGIGLVRGIDPARGVLFLIMSVPLEELQGVNTLIQGKVDLPLQLLSAPPYVSPYLAFNSIAAEGTGSAMVKSRNNIIRKVGD